MLYSSSNKTVNGIIIGISNNDQLYHLISRCLLQQVNRVVQQRIFHQTFVQVQLQEPDITYAVVKSLFGAVIAFQYVLLA